MKKIKKGNSNIFFGMMGAICWALPVAAFLLMFCNSPIANAIAGMVLSMFMVFFAYQGYISFARRKDKKAEITALVVSVITLIVAHCFQLGLFLYSYLGWYDEVTILEAVMYAFIILPLQTRLFFWALLLLNLFALGLGYRFFVRNDADYIDPRCLEIENESLNS